MKLLEAINTLNGKPAEIPDSSRYDLPQLFKELGFKTGAEIGVYRGDFTKKFAEAGFKMNAIDAWFGFPGTTQEKQDSIFKFAKNNLQPYPNCKIIRKLSMEAVKEFSDNSLDFVYIDATHEFRHFADDLVEWSKKVRPGGIVSGHDYFFVERGSRRENHEVEYVLKAYVEAFNIPNFYTLRGRDRWLSWFFVKQ